MTLCVLETLCAILVVTIYLLQFSHVSRLHIDETIKSLINFIENKAGELKNAAQALMPLDAELERIDDPITKEEPSRERGRVNGVGP